MSGAANTLEKLGRFTGTLSIIAAIVVLPVSYAGFWFAIGQVQDDVPSFGQQVIGIGSIPVALFVFGLVLWWGSSQLSRLLERHGL